MMWVDYTINQAGNNFKVLGEWEGEVMGKKEDGSDKGYALYRPGDVFVVNEGGWLCKVEDVGAMIIKYEASKNERK
jgi:hypothetical protein